MLSSFRVHIKKIKILHYGLFVLLLLISVFLYMHWNSVAINNKQIIEDFNKKREYIGIQEDDYYKGNSSSTIIVIEYFDLECTWCKLYHTQLRLLHSNFIDNGVIFVYRSFPLNYLHRQAQEEALAHECAGLLGGQSTFFSYMEKVYYHTKGNDTLDTALLPIFAKELGINVDDFNSCRKATSTISLLNSKISRGLSQGIKMTPSYVIFSEKESIILHGKPSGLEKILQSLVDAVE
jgi:protein-disulfide isomerase